jgi:hypothetical protein
MSLIPLLKGYPNTYFGTSTMPSSGGSLKFYIDPMFLKYIRTVKTVYKKLQYSIQYLIKELMT